MAKYVFEKLISVFIYILLYKFEFTQHCISIIFTLGESFIFYLFYYVLFCVWRNRSILHVYIHKKYV